MTKLIANRFAFRINDRHLQVSDRPVVPMFDSSQDSLEVLRDGLPASAGVFDDQRPRRDRIGKIGPALKRVCRRTPIVRHTPFVPFTNIRAML